MPFLPTTAGGYPLGCLPRMTKPGDGTFQVLGEPDTAPLKPRSEWTDGAPYADYIWHIIDQSSIGSCCLAMSAGGIMTVREATGFDRVVLSEGSGYAFEDASGTPRRSDNGQNIDTGLQIIQKIGLAPTSVIGQYDWEGYRRGTWPDNWRDESAKYRSLEAWDCPTVEHIGSAVEDDPVAIGVRWQGGGGHAVLIVGKRKVQRQWKFRILNSHGRGYGNNGIGELPESQVEEGAGIYGAWALRVVIAPSDEQIQTLD